MGSYLQSKIRHLELVPGIVWNSWSRLVVEPRLGSSCADIDESWSVGGGMIIYLAGLQSIPTTFYEAAQLDGANGWQQFFRITIPLMSPVILYNLIIGIIGTFQYFTEVYVLTSGLTGGPGGPAKSTLFYNVYLYSNAFRYMNMGYASALAWVLFVIVLLLTLLVFRSSAAWVYYEGELQNK